MVLLAACSGNGRSPGGREAVPATPRPSARPEAPPEVLVERTYHAFRRAVAARDAAAAFGLLSEDAVAYVASLARATAEAGPGAIETLTPFQRLTIAVVRTEWGTSPLPPDEFLDRMFHATLVRMPPSARDPGPVRLRGDGAVIAFPPARGRRLRVTFELGDGAWTIGAHHIFEVGSWGLEGVVATTGQDMDDSILGVAGALADEKVTAAIWKRPR
jgi:hypothetical protein